MEKKYLTPALKEYYMREYQKFKNITDDFWSLDPHIQKSLDKINKNSNVQTLSSARYSIFKLINPNPQSYLYFTITEPAEINLAKNFVPFFQKKYKKYEFSLMFQAPSLHWHNEYNNNYDLSDTIKQMEFVKNPDYFNVNIVNIGLVTKDLSVHDWFWKDLENELAKL